MRSPAWVIQTSVLEIGRPLRNVSVLVFSIPSQHALKVRYYLKKQALGLLLVVSVPLGACTAPPAEESETPVKTVLPQVEEWELLQDLYLGEIAESAPSNFANEAAALSYLKQYCEIDQFGDAGETDVVDRIVSKYCNTALATRLGVKTPSVALKEVDEAEFTRIAGEQFGVFEETYDDGSSNTPVSLAKYICENADVSELERNLGDDFPTSFQWFAMETFCPQKLG